MTEKIQLMRIFRRTRPKLIVYFRSISYVIIYLFCIHFHINFFQDNCYSPQFYLQLSLNCRTQSKAGTPVRHLTYCDVRVCRCCFPELNSLLKRHTLDIFFLNFLFLLKFSMWFLSFFFARCKKIWEDKSLVSSYTYLWEKNIFIVLHWNFDL